MERKRWVDIAKALGIFCVVTYHALPAGTLMYRYFATFHLPLFAFLSGYVFNSLSVRTKKGLLCYFKKKIKTIYVPFISYSLLFMITHNLCCKLHFIGEVNGNFLYTGYSDYVKKTVQILTLGGVNHSLARCGI